MNPYEVIYPGNKTHQIQTFHFTANFSLPKPSSIQRLSPVATCCHSNEHHLQSFESNISITMWIESFFDKKSIWLCIWFNIGLIEQCFFNIWTWLVSELNRKHNEKSSAKLFLKYNEQPTLNVIKMLFYILQQANFEKMEGILSVLSVQLEVILSVTGSTGLLWLQSSFEYH